MRNTPLRLSNTRVGAVALAAVFASTLGLAGVAGADRVTELEVAVADNPRSAELHARLGCVKLESGDIEGARAAFERSVDLAPGWAKSHEYLGCVLSQQGAYGEALARLTRALELTPDDREIWESRARAKREAGFLRGAIEDLTEATRLGSGNAATWCARGKAHFDIGAYEAAANDLRLACALDPKNQDDARLYLWLARAAGGDRAAASRELAGYLDGREGAPAGDWYAALGVFLLGGFDQVELMKLADEGEDGPDKTRRRCEAHFYTGFVNLIDGASAEATESFRECVSTGVDGSTEHDSAVAALDRMTKKSLAGANE